MFTRVAWLAMLTPLCAGVTCRVTLPGDEDVLPGYVQLDRATAELSITAAVSDTTASAVATIRRNGGNVELQNGQDLAVNGLSLLGPGPDGMYSRSVPRAAAYVVEVHEPTLGTYQTIVNAPADFAFTSPVTGEPVSLAGGFTLAWSNPSPSATYTLTLAQTLGGATLKVLGPFADETGSLPITSQDLMAFRQGADITITLVKTAQQTGLEGFASGTARVELSQTLRVVPGP